MSGIELINQWYYDPGTLAIMQNCANTQMGGSGRRTAWTARWSSHSTAIPPDGQP